MNENPDFEQKYYSRTAKGIYKLGMILVNYWNG